MTVYCSVPKSSSALSQRPIFESFIKFNSVKLFYKMLLSILVTVRLTNEAPLDWHRSHPFAANEGNNHKMGTDALKLTRVLCPVGKAFYKGLPEKPPQIPSHFQGFAKGRRREAAVLAQEVAPTLLFLHQQISAARRRKQKLEQ